MQQQQLMQDDAGNVWDMSKGAPVLVKPAQGASGGANVIIPAAPKDPPKPEFVPGHPNQVYTPGAGVSTLPGVAAPPPPAPNFVPGKPGYVVGGSPDKPTAVQIAGLPGAGVDTDASQRAKAIQQYTYGKQLDAVADHLNQLFLKGPGATQGLQGFKDFFPSPENKNFDAEANKSRGIVGQALGFTGGQLNTPQEAEKAVGPYIPEAGNFDSTILQKIASMRELAQTSQQNAIKTLGGVPDENGIIHPITGSNPPPPITAPDAPDQAAIATGKTHSVIDPVLKATGAKVGRMLASGVPGSEIEAFLRKSGVDPASTDLAAKLKYRGTPEYQRWQRANPGQPYPIGPSFYTKEVPMTDTRALLNKTAASGVGGAVLAAPVAAANAITGGYLNDATANPEATQTGMNLLRGAHPVASLVGDVAGQATDEAALGLIPGAQGLMATKWGRRGVDALYNGFSGSGENDTNRGIGAVGGAGLGVLGGMFGRGAQKALGQLGTGIQDASLQYLHNAGVPLTAGRIMRGVGTIHGPSNIADEVGKGAGGIEERLMGLPGMDAVIGTARQRGDAAFNNEAFRQIAPGVVGHGTDGLTSAKAAETAAYAKLNGVRFGVDPQFDGALSNIETSARGLNRHASDVADVIKDVRAQIANGEISGEGFQSALQTVRNAKSSLSNDVMGHKAAGLLDGLDAELNSLGSRQGGTVAQDLADANAIHGRREIIKAASKGPAAQTAELFSPKSLNQASIANTTKYGGLDKALSPDRPFFDLARAGMDVMPNLTPDSGTAGRMQLYRALGSGGVALGGGIGALTGDNSPQRATEGGGMGLGGGVALGALLSAPYSKAGQRLIQNALLAERPAAVKKLGQYLINANPRLAGMFGSSGARDYVFQPEDYLNR